MAHLSCLILVIDFFSPFLLRKLSQEFIHFIDLLKEPAFSFVGFLVYPVFSFSDFCSDFYYFLLLILNLIFSFPCFLRQKLEWSTLLFLFKYMHPVLSFFLREKMQYGIYCILQIFILYFHFYFVKNFKKILNTLIHVSFVYVVNIYILGDFLAVYCY